MERQPYRIGRSTLTVVFGHIRRSNAEVLVSSDDAWLSMGGGVSAALAAAGGPALRRDAAKCIPLSAGDVAVTTAGDMTARYVFHVVTIGPRERVREQPERSTEAAIIHTPRDGRWSC